MPLYSETHSPRANRYLTFASNLQGRGKKYSKAQGSSLCESNAPFESLLNKMYVVFLNRLFDSLFLFERISKSDCENV